MNVFIVYCVVSADAKEKQSYILSLDDQKIIFPIYKVDSPKHILNEIRYNIKSIFNKKSMQFAEQIVVSNLKIDNELLLDYILDIDVDKVYDIDNNLFLMCGVVMEKLDIDKSVDFKWMKFKYSMQDKITQPVYAIIDSILQNSL